MRFIHPNTGRVLTYLRSPRVPYLVPPGIDRTIENVCQDVQHNIHRAYRNQIPISSLIWKG